MATILSCVFWLCAALVLYVYAGYPLLVWLVSRFAAKPQPPPAQDYRPSVTVIIPAHNEEGWIRRKIENTLYLDYPRDRLQVLVASDGCTDGTVSIAGQFAARGVEVNHFAEQMGKTATLNRVVPTARGEIVLLTDAKALLEPGSLGWLVRHFCDPGVGCVTGARLCTSTNSPASGGEGLYWRYELWIKRSESLVHSCMGSHGQIMAVRKSSFPSIAGSSDDFYVPMRILIATGARVVFEPRAKAHIPAAATMRQELERKTRSHTSPLFDLPHLRAALDPRNSPVWWQFLSHHVLRFIVPFAMIAALISSALLARAGDLYLILFLCQCAFYSAALFGFLFLAARIPMRLFYFPFYFCFANLAVFRAWFRWLRNERRMSWSSTQRGVPPGSPIPGL